MSIIFYKKIEFIFDPIKGKGTEIKILIIRHRLYYELYLVKKVIALHYHHLTAIISPPTPPHPPRTASEYSGSAAWDSSVPQ